ncbi:MAG: RIP metalloprotease RseP [Amoebophilaceae bacterium]|nr:RIP metalloprotease RseP [Amoebophilaceae bacterium]
MASIVTVIQFMAGLSIIVGIHELGHLLLAKLFKMRVHSYIIGFPPKLFKFKVGETEYALGAIPLGGAVQIAGMVDELLEAENLPSSPAPWEFRSKSAGQRLLVILGGIIFNLISGICIYISLAYIMGYTYLPKHEVNQYGVVPDSIGIEMGFQEGDKLIKINGKDFEDFNDFMSPSLLLGVGSYYTIDRKGVALTLPIPDRILEQISDKKHPAPFLWPIRPYVIGAVLPHSRADVAGLVPGDQLITIAGEPAGYLHQLQKMTDRYEGQEVAVTYLRQGVTMQTVVKMDKKSGLEGVQIKVDQPVMKHIKYAPLQSIVAGIKDAVTCMHQYYLGIWGLVTGKLSMKKFVGGPISIATVFGNEFNGFRFWKLVGYFSITIALTNLLPIPVLDGGHSLFIIYECLFGRRPSDRFLAITHKFGVTLLVLLMVYAFGNDIRKLLS